MLVGFFYILNYLKATRVLKNTKLKFMLMFFTPLFFITLVTIIFIKRKKQLGKTWEKPFQSTVSIKDKELKCSHCTHNKFNKREGLLNTSWVTFFQFAFLNYSAPCYSCCNCGFLHWFVEPKEKVEVKKQELETEVKED
jgi:hypothetical protein